MGSFRHWVKHALAAWQWHKPPIDGSMKNVYDTPGQEAILDEHEQRAPHGPIGFVVPPEIAIVDDVDRDVLEVARAYFAGSIGITTLLDRLDAIRRKHVQESIVKP